MLAQRFTIQAIGFLGLAAVLGCSGGSTGPFATVSGTVTQGGNPIDSAKLEFHGTTEGQGGARDVFATYTDSSGKYMISGVGKNAGIPPGMYKVVITKYRTKSGAMPMDAGAIDVGQLEAQASDLGSAAVGLNNLLPKEYASINTTKLSATIQEGKNENVNFDLKGK
jgi:hypothetical protein